MRNHYKLQLSALVASTLCLYSITAAANEYISSEEFPADVVTAIVPLGTLAIAHYDDDGKGEGQFLRSTGASLVVNSLLRLGFNETSWGERPNGSPYGFPSGHAAFMTSSAAFLQDRYGWKLGLPAYALVGYVSWVRVDTGHHRWRDVIAGVALSYSISKLFVTPQNAPNITPVIGPKYLGLRWERSFR
jgi:membrane-associated phospholipid phosphatase